MGSNHDVILDLLSWPVNSDLLKKANTLPRMEHNILQKLLGKERDGLKLSFKKDKEACLIYLFVFQITCSSVWKILWSCYRWLRTASKAGLAPGTCRSSPKQLNSVSSNEPRPCIRQLGTHRLQLVLTFTAITHTEPSTRSANRPSKNHREISRGKSSPK